MSVLFTIPCRDENEASTLKIALLIELGCVCLASVYCFLHYMVTVIETGIHFGFSCAIFCDIFYSDVYQFLHYMALHRLQISCSQLFLLFFYLKEILSPKNTLDCHLSKTTYENNRVKNVRLLQSVKVDHQRSCLAHDGEHTTCVVFHGDPLVACL